MGFDDKADATKDKVAGKIKEGAGKLTGDKKTEAEGQGQNFQGKVKDGVADAKDSARDIRDKTEGFTEGLKKD